MTNSRRIEHAVITGANRGIGAAIAHALAPTGAKISLFGRNREALEKVAGELSTETSVAIADVTDGASVQAAFAQAKEKFGAVTILVNNAGQARSAPLHVGDESLWNEMLAVNLGSVYRCIRCVLPDMLQAGREHRRADRLPVRDCLLCGQARRDRIDAGTRNRVGAEKHHRQCSVPGLHRYGSLARRHCGDPGEDGPFRS